MKHTYFLQKLPQLSPKMRPSAQVFEFNLTASVYGHAKGRQYLQPRQMSRIAICG
jgi:hypothetical protein